MLPEDIAKMVRRMPFQPFRIHMSNGQSFLVRHPELAMVGIASVVVGTPSPKHQQPIYDDYEVLSIFHINRLEPVPAAPAAASKRAKQ